MAFSKHIKKVAENLRLLSTTAASYDKARENKQEVTKVALDTSKVASFLKFYAAND